MAAVQSKHVISTIQQSCTKGLKLGRLKRDPLKRQDSDFNLDVWITKSHVLSQLGHQGHFLHVKFGEPKFSLNWAGTHPGKANQPNSRNQPCTSFFIFGHLHQNPLFHCNSSDLHLQAPHLLCYQLHPLNLGGSAVRKEKIETYTQHSCTVNPPVHMYTCTLTP